MTRAWIALCCAVLVGCATPAVKTAPVDDGAALRLAEADLEQSMDKFGDGIVLACVNTIATPAEAETCVREKVASAIANPEGEKYCNTISDIDAYGRCITMGDWLNTMRRNAGSPKPLSEAEWLDLEKAIDNTTTEIMTQSLVQCAGKGGLQLEACQSDLLVKSLGISAADVTACNGVTDGKCLGTRSIAQYIRDKTLTVY